MALSQEEIDYHKRIFDIADLDKDGFVTMDDIYRLEGQLPKSLEMMFREAIDADNDDRLSFDEFLNLVSQ